MKPLAERMRPLTLDDYLGQQHLVGQGAVLRKSIETDLSPGIATPGPHTITSTEPAGVILYGYDQVVSYGYTGGLDLSVINTETQFGGGAAAP